MTTLYNDVRVRRAALALALSLSLPLAGCRDSDGDGSGPSGPTPASLAGALGVGPVGGTGGVLLEQEPNDSPSQVQYLGGIAPGTSYTIRGDITADGSDPFDGFRLVTEAPVALHMELAYDEPSADLDFFLYDVAGGTTLASFETTANPEVGDYTVATAGFELDLVVVPFQGASGYELTISGSAPPSAPSAAPAPAASLKHADLEARWLGAQHPMVPGRVVVLEGDAALSHPGRAGFLAREGLELVSRTPDGTSIYRLVPDLAATLPKGAPGAFHASLEHATARRALAFSRQPGVRAASPDYLVEAFGQPSDTHYPLQWHYPQMRLPLAWDLATGSSSVVVAVIDTGFTPHPDLLSRFVGGYDFISDPAIAGDGDGMDPDATDPGDGQGPYPSSWHGTHVAGTVGASSDDGVGVSGVDWGCGILNLRALGIGGGTSSDIAAAVRYAARLANASGQLPAQKADVINMSLGTPSASSVLQAACADAQAAGATIVAAAGNEPNSVPKYPAAFPSVIAVGAVRFDKQLAPYSSFGSWVDVVAPGGDLNVDQNGDGYPDGVLSTYTDGQGDWFYGFQQGTSMAAPHVAGLAALLRAADPNLTPAQIRQLLRDTTQDLGAPGFDTTYGHGLVDAHAALVAATAPMQVDPILVVEPLNVDLGASQTELVVALDNAGAGTIDVTGTSVEYLDGNGWLDAELLPAPAGAGISHGGLRLTVDRAGLPLGDYAALVDVQADGFEPVGIGVQMSVGEPPPPDLVVFVLAVDAQSFETAEQAIATLASGYAWDIPQLAPGSYYLVAGTDVDDDGFIGDAEEPVFGMYPSSIEPVVLEVAEGDELQGLDFPVTTGTIGALGAGSQSLFRRR